MVPGGCPRFDSTTYNSLEVENITMGSLILFVTFLGIALGDEDPIPRSNQNQINDELTINEMVISSDGTVERTRAELEREILNLGYQAGETRGDRVIYRPIDAWKPSIVIYNDAFVWIRRTPPRFEPWIENNAPIGYLSCIPPFTLLCIKTQGVLVSRRRLQHQKTDISEAIDPFVSEWREAVANRAARVRNEQEVPQLLEDLWRLGIPIEASDIILNTPPERRAAIFDFWSSRTCTYEGQSVRDTTLFFLQQEVQTSETPATRSEVEQANAHTSCDDALPWPLIYSDPAG